MSAEPQAKSDEARIRNIAIIFAGGVGARMGYADGPKQFMDAATKPLIVYTLDLFEHHPRIDHVYVSTVATHIEYMRKLVQGYGLKKVRAVVRGGGSAHQSIINALDAAADDGQPDEAIALIHDGVRPLIPLSLIDANIEDVRMTGTSITSIPAYETVCESGDGVAADTVLDRNNLYILQAPQCFRLGHIRRINARAQNEGRVGAFVDMANMMDFYGEPLQLTRGTHDNIKITVPGDFRYFAYLVETGQYDPEAGGAA